MSGLNYKKLGSTLSNICNTTQLDNATKCHYAFKNFWGEPWDIYSHKQGHLTKMKNSKVHNSSSFDLKMFDLIISQIKKLDLVGS